MSLSSKPAKRIALVAGGWSTNIGNAFYNLGARWLLKSLGLDVFFLPESPIWKRKVTEHYDHVADVDADLFVLVGPCLWSRLAEVYTDTFDRIYARGGQVAYLSAGMAHYTAEEAAFVLKFLEIYPPLFLSTRDGATFDYLSGGLHCPTHNGICCSMFLNDALRPIPVRKQNYVVFNFDDIEPELEIDASGAARVIHRSRWGRASPAPRTIDGKEIVRTINLSIDEGYAKIYARPNCYHSDLPEGYCSILAAAQTVYSERVHTCATALIYGTEAQFVQHAPRSFEKRNFLFDRLRVSDIVNRPCRLDMPYICSEKQNQRDFLASVLCK